MGNLGEVVGKDYVEVICGFCRGTSRQSVVRVPLYIFDVNGKKNYYEYGDVRKEFYRKDLDIEGFVSGEGLIYCSRECWANYCSD